MKRLLGDLFVRLFSGGVFIYKNMEVTVYIFIALFLLGIVRKRDAPSFMLLREILCS